MSLIPRVVKLVKADIHAFLDRLEDQGQLLKQHLRDMEEALDRKELQLNQLTVTRRQIQQQHASYRQPIAQLDQDVAAAIRRDKEDIARLLIRKQKMLIGVQDKLGRQGETLDQEIAQLRERLAQQRIQYAQIKRRARAYLRSASRKPDGLPDPPWTPSRSLTEIAEAEVELEFLQRKEALKGGAVT
ncbi:MAG: PspA/IM30 family protein [Desulfobacterales bacterium]|nr:MAG: PspA/IM30 family protein [Desulfobacterales bacterium]